MFPTYDTIPRPWKPLAANVATLLAMQRNHKGAAFSPWGPSPVTILRTATGSPYNFVFHDMSDPGNKEPLGHMLVIGPSGSGKTVTVSWLAMMAMRYPELRVRSEEHTSELQSLMRISYAVFCLKKKKNNFD